MCETTNTVEEYYNSYNEDGRMERNPLEFIRTKELISRYLSNDNMLILDVGGATGAYSFWLAQNGHNVSLIDFTKKHIEQAKQKELDLKQKLNSIVVGDARDLPYEGNTFDIVLLMGPLYHLTDKHDRTKAYKEAHRVLKPGGRVICSYISRFASMFDGFIYGFVNDKEFMSIMSNDLKMGIHKNNTDNKTYFTDAYLHHPDEISIELIEAGFIYEDLFAIESFGNTIPGADEKLKNADYQRLLLETIRLIEKDPSLFGISSHLLAVGKK